jgi:hypothetical protein
MKKLYFFTLIVLLSLGARAQKVESISFNLYTDSLKKGVHNYINLDGKLSTGAYYPLTSSEIIFSSSYGKWEGSSLIIDSAYSKDSVVIVAKLKDSPTIQKSITVYIKKVDEQPELKTEKELLEEWRSKAKKKN